MLSPCDRVASGACPESGCFRGHSSGCPSGNSTGRTMENLVMENYGDGKHRAPCPRPMAPWEAVLLDLRRRLAFDNMHYRA